jgi:hypothetical protein
LLKKAALREDIQLIRILKGIISKEQAEVLKLKKAQEHASAMNYKVAVEQEKSGNR